MMIIIIWLNWSMWPKYQFTFGEDTEQAPAAVCLQRTSNPLHESMIGDDLYRQPIWQPPATRTQTALHSPPPLKKNLAKKKFLSRGCQGLQLWWPHPRPEPCLTGSPMATTKSSSAHVTKIINQKLFRQISTNNWSRSIETPTASARRFLSAWRSGAFFSEMKMTSSSKSSSQVHLFKFTRKLYEWMILMHLTC